MMRRRLFQLRRPKEDVAFRNNIYVLGKNNETSLNTVEVFETIMQRCILIQSMEFPRYRFAVVISGETSIFIGRNGHWSDKTLSMIVQLQLLYTKFD